MTSKLINRMTIISVLTCCSLIAAAADLPERLEYAYGYALGVQSDSEYFSVGIPFEVYQSAADAKLRDIAVFNGNGISVPRILNHEEVDDEEIEVQVALDLVPFFGKEVDQPDQLHVLLRSDENGLMLDMDLAEVNRQKARVSVGRETPTSYLADFRNLQHSIEALVFEFPEFPEGFMGSVLLEDSVDLQYWRKVGSATLAELRHEDALILQNRIELSKIITHYLRISWSDMPENWQIESAAGIYFEDEQIEEREWITLDAISPDRDASEFFFTAGGSPPVDRVSVLLPNDNVVVRASIFHRANRQNEWRKVTEGVFYNVTRQGNRFETPAMEIATSRLSEWKVVIDSGVTGGPVRVKLGWRPDKLLFVAQGSAPFEMVTGRAEASLQGFPEDSLLGDSRIFDVLLAAGPPGSAALGPRESIMGAKGLDLRKTADWKQLALWAGLLLAVLVVGKMTFSLLRDLKLRGESD